MSNLLDQALGLPDDQSAFPWQRELLARFRDGRICRALDIPTGLGKTAVMAVWLVALVGGASLPRRLIYVVDRRAVVDQATREAEKLRAWVEHNPDVTARLGLKDGERLPISTLRGQHVDNREWLEDPSRPAIIVGTVDMIGSRLLFEGYGVTRRMRPYHAGLLGADSLAVIDEAHLVPPFEMMLQTLVSGESEFIAEGELINLIPDMHVLSLSATGRDVVGDVLRLDDEDLKHPVAKKRLDAPKRLSFRELDGSQSLAESLGQEGWRLAAQGQANVRILVFSNSREVAQNALNVVEKYAKGDKKKGAKQILIEAELFVGERRVREREDAANWLRRHGFLADSKERPTEPTFLFATSAGEVGVDLDADHMVCDLVAWERMVQRLGRVNRRGDVQATVSVLVESPQLDKKTQEAIDKAAEDRSNAEQKKADQFEAQRKRVKSFKRPILQLPTRGDGDHDASPGAIRVLQVKAERNEPLASVIAAATSPVPLRPALTRPIVDAWSMTSMEKHTGRPVVAPWLRGWVDDEPQTTLLWRRWLPVCEGSQATEKKQKADAREFFQQAPPHLSETLEAESSRVLDWLLKRGKIKQKQAESAVTDDEDNPLTTESVVGIILGPALDVQRMFTLGDLIFEGHDKKNDKRRKDALQRDLYNNTVVLDLRFGGLSKTGLLDLQSNDSPELAGDDEGWFETGFYVVKCDADTTDADFRACVPFVARVSPDNEPKSWLLVKKSKDSAASEEGRSIAPTPQELVTHQQWAETEASRLASRLDVPPAYAKMLRLVARLHDEGKRAERWQRAFSAPPGDVKYAKTPGPVKPNLLGGYRHEFGSLAVVESDPEFQELNPDLQDLALHLVAAHHGFARPSIRTDGCEDGPPSVLEGRARDVALRFARLQRRWGPWGLAWWESLLRAADQRASRKLDEEQEATDG